MYDHLGLSTNSAAGKPHDTALPCDNIPFIITWLRIALLHVGVLRIDQLAMDRKPSAL